MKKSGASHLRVRGFARASKQYRTCLKIENASPQAAATYGHQVYGVFGSGLLAMRRRLGHVASSARRNR